MPTLTIPESTYRQLAERAARTNTTVDDLAVKLLARDSNDPFDSDYHTECGAETAPVPTLTEVRAILAKLPGSLTADLIAERDER